MNICYCGTQAGYPHRDECPYPLFRAVPAEEYRWEAARQARAEALALVREGTSRRALDLDGAACHTADHYDLARASLSV